MNVGDYVRTNGKIRKIVQELKTELLRDKGNTVVSISENIREYLLDDNTTIYNCEKSSPNIIDLIEVGDYVNGYMVENIDAGLNGDIIEIATGTNYFQSPTLYEEDIKSIVTKEQFESMEYKLEVKDE